MIWRNLLGITKNMGPFEISVIWLALPSSVKDKIPSEIKNLMEDLAKAVAAYKLVVSAYHVARKALDATKEVQTAASLPTNPAVASAITATEVAEQAVIEGKNQLSIGSINTFLDSEMI